MALDAGSSWTRVLAAELFEGALRYCGHGMAPSAGMRKGLIAELGPAAKAVRAAIDQTEFTSGLYIGSCPHRRIPGRTPLSPQPYPDNRLHRP